MSQIGNHAAHTFEEVEASGPAARPLDFPPPDVKQGVRLNALVVHPTTGQRDILPSVIHRKDILHGGSSKSGEGGAAGRSRNSLVREDRGIVAYWPQRMLQEAIFGSIWLCLVLKIHVGEAADDAARAAGVEPGDPKAPIVWEMSGTNVAIKMVEWARVLHFRGRLLEDPVKEVAAMQYIGTGHPHVLSSLEILQDQEYLYSVMPYANGGDLFGVVTRHTEENGGESGMQEPACRYWFRQILSGLHHLQSKGICHRDLSLENILVDDENCVILVMDFGMCLRVPYSDRQNPSMVTGVTTGGMRRLLKPQGTCGKLNYMSPEILHNKENFDGFAIDLWAAGVILYVMLTGFPPYDQPSLTDQRFEIIIDGKLVEQLQNWGIDLTNDAGDLLQRMLQLNPRDRLTLTQVMNHPWITNPEVEHPVQSERPY